MLVKLKNNYGFTLVELAMVLFIVGLLLGGMLVPLSTKLEQDNRETTNTNLNDIREALLGYAVINRRLPCPDCPDGATGSCSAVAAANRNDGMEDRSGSTPNRLCQTDIGNLPWVDLQAGEFDAWGRHFTYRVTPAFSRETNTTACGTAAIDVAFEICTPGDIDIYNSYTAPPYPTPPTVADNVPAIVISHGADALEPSQTSQQIENYGRNPVNPATGANVLSSYIAGNYSANVFIYSDYRRDTSINPPTQFDDMVIWISPNLLMNRMIVSGRLP